MENTLLKFFSRYMPLTDDEKQAISEFNSYEYFKKGTILLQEGQISEVGYYVIQGMIRCYYIIDKEEKTTAFYSENEGLTPICSVNRKPSTYFISCVEDTTLIFWNPEMERVMLKKFPRFETVCRILSEHLLAKSRIEFDEFKISSPEQRYLSLMRSRPDLLQRVPQYQLASYLGVTPQSLSRMRSRLMDKERKNYA